MRAQAPAGEAWSGHSLRKGAASGAGALDVALAVSDLLHTWAAGQFVARRCTTTSTRRALPRPPPSASLDGSFFPPTHSPIWLFPEAEIL